MHLLRPVVVGCAILLSGCQSHYTPPEEPMPPHTILLSQMMRELSAQPGFTQTVIAEIEGGKSASAKRGPALLTPKLADELRKRILGNDWSGLDRFPGWTMREINPTVRVAGHLAGKDEKLESEAAVHPGAPPSSVESHSLDLGPYGLERAQTVSLDQPSTFAGFTAQGIITRLGAGVTRGDGPNQLAPEHAESQRLADVLNRLAANRLDGAAALRAVIHGKAGSTPEDLVSLLQQSGDTVTVTDSRYFANFGHLHYKGQDVMMPFWINTQIRIPGTRRPLLVPVSHAELEWHVRGPKINADLAWYFGIDGKAEWRTMDTLDQAWVLRRDAHTYTGAQALEATRLAALFTVAYMHQHARRPSLPFGGYYALGVCQDSVSAIEHKLTGHSTLFPNTADAALFDDARDAEVNRLIAAIPKDRSGASPEPERIFGSLPTTDLAAITIPGLSADLRAVYAAWQQGSLRRIHRALFYAAACCTVVACAAVVLALFRRREWPQRARSQH